MSTQVSVTERALFTRINRKLKHDGETLRRCRPRWESSLGRYYSVDINLNAVTGSHYDLENLGRELDVMKPFERLEAGN